MEDKLEELGNLARELEGWLSDDEGGLLYDLAKQVPREQAIVELGKWGLRSLVWLAGGSAAGYGATVYTIDLHSGSETRKGEGEMNAHTAFLTSLTEAGVQATIVPLDAASDKGARRWRKGIGLLWIDASREYEDVKHDFLAWKQHLLPGAVVALHGCDKPGPAQLAEEYFNQSGDFTTIQSVDTIIVAAKDKCTHYWFLDSKDIGVCKYCGRKRDFRRLSLQSSRKAKSE